MLAEQLVLSDRLLLADAVHLVGRRLGLSLNGFAIQMLEQAIVDRMMVLDVPLERYLDILRGDEGEVGHMTVGALVPHTSFFRDAAVFDALQGHVIPALAHDRAVLRTWVIGSATGEEAWSVAMLLRECLNGLDRFEVIATDIEKTFLDRAKAAIYASERVDEVGPERRARHFFPLSDGRLVVEPNLRGRVRFAQHDLMGSLLAPDDAVVARFDLVMCRNVLLWFEPRMRAKALARLAAVLSPGGWLVLGQSETLSINTLQFKLADEIAPGLRIFQRTEEP